MNLLKPLTYIPIRYLLPLAWIFAIILSSLYAYESVKSKHLKNTIETRYLQELNFFEHSKETASHAMKTVEIKQLKKIFTLFSTEKERTLGIYSFKEKQDLSPTNLTLMLEYDGYKASKQFEGLKKSLCEKDRVISLKVKEGLWYFFSSIGEECEGLLYFERVNLIDKMLHDQEDFYELVMKLVSGLFLGMIVIRTAIYFLFHKRLGILLSRMKKSTESLTHTGELLEGNDEIAEISKAFDAASHQLRVILNDMYTFIALIDAQGKMVFVNNAPLKISGLEVEDILDKPFCDALWWSYSQSVKDEVCEILQRAMTGEKVQEEIQIEIAHKQKIWINFNIHPVYNHEGHLLHLVAEGVDITRQKEAYAKLIEQNPKAQMGEMMDAVAHQWKQPLNALSLHAELLKEDFSEGKIDSNYIDGLTEDIFSQIEHMQITLNEFRSFLRPNTKVSQVRLIEIIQAVQLLIKDEFVNNAISIDVEIDEGIELFVNKSEFKHILLSILNNAKDAFNEKEIEDRWIKIKASKSSQGMTLQIEDNAGGIKASVIRHIFKKGFTTKEAAEGTGVGLFLSSQIIQKLGGKISVENTDNGACFIIEI